jgi:hypothetical protein
MGASKCQLRAFVGRSRRLALAALVLAAPKINGDDLELPSIEQVIKSRTDVWEFSNIGIECYLSEVWDCGLITPLALPGRAVNITASVRIADGRARAEESTAYHVHGRNHWQRSQRLGSEMAPRRPPRRHARALAKSHGPSGVPFPVVAPFQGACRE